MRDTARSKRSVSEPGPRYPQVMEWPTLIVTLLAENPLPHPTPSPILEQRVPPTLTPAPGTTTGPGRSGTAVSGVSAWLPVWTATIGAVAGIGGSALSHVIAGKNENKRRGEQNVREDAQRKRDELKLVYSDLIRNLDEYVLAVHRYKSAKPIFETLAELNQLTPGRDKLMTKQEDLSEKMVGLAATINSLLGILDLLGEKTSFDASYAYFAFIKDLDPAAETASSIGQGLNAAMKDAMRKSLAG